MISSGRKGRFRYGVTIFRGSGPRGNVVRNPADGKVGKSGKNLLAFADGSVEFFLKRPDQFVHGQNLVYTEHIGAAEGESLAEVAAHGVDQSKGDAVGRFFLLTGAHAMENALERFGFFRPAWTR